VPVSVCVSGTFGRVYYGTLESQENESTEDQPVLVKTVTGQYIFLTSNSVVEPNFLSLLRSDTLPASDYMD